MNCANCVRHVQEALACIEGVDKVEVDLATGKVVIQHASPAAPLAQLIAAVEDAGYTTKPQA